MTLFISSPRPVACRIPNVERSKPSQSIPLLFIQDYTVAHSRGCLFPALTSPSSGAFPLAHHLLGAFSLKGKEQHLNITRVLGVGGAVSLRNLCLCFLCGPHTRSFSRMQIPRIVPELLRQDLHFHKTHRSFVGMLTFQKHWAR